MKNPLGFFLWYLIFYVIFLYNMLFFKTGYAYFTDWRLGGIVRVRKSDGGEMTIIRRGISNIMHVKAYDAHSQIGEPLSSTEGGYEIGNKRQNVRTADFQLQIYKWLQWIITDMQRRQHRHLESHVDYFQLFKSVVLSYHCFVTRCNFPLPLLLLYLTSEQNEIMIHCVLCNCITNYNFVFLLFW